MVSRTTLLIKALYLSRYERRLRDPSTPLLDIDENTIDVCFKVVQGKRGLQTRSTKGVPIKETDSRYREPKTERKEPTEAEVREQARKIEEGRVQNREVFAELSAIQSRHFGGPLPDSDLSVSGCLVYARSQLDTAYKNNIEARYESYVRKFVKMWLCRRFGVEKPSKPSPEIKNLGWRVSSVMLFGADHAVDELTSDELRKLRARVCVARDNMSELGLELHIQKHHGLYLQKMVCVARALEKFNDHHKDDRYRVPSPLCLSKSFVPGHVRFDTNGIAQLLFDQPRIDAFVDEYYAMHGVRLHNLSTKAHLGSSVKKLSSDKDADETEHATRIWQFLGKFDNRKYADVLKSTRGPDKVPWVFDNAIVTDGYSVCFQVTPASSSKKRYGARPTKTTKSEKLAVRRTEFERVQDCRFRDDVTYVGVDPGKGALVTMSDGVTTLAYTSGRRNRATLKSARTFQQLAFRNHQVVGQGTRTLADYETEVMSTTTSRTCHLERFLLYVALRREIEPEAKRLYARPIFRQHKFLVHCKTKSSDQRFVNRILPTFSRPAGPPYHWMTADRPECRSALRNVANRSHATRSEVVLLYGDWGRNPNLRGSAPTPGIGLRRKIHKRFQSITTPEHFTSQTCPCCRERSLKNVNLITDPSPVIQEEPFHDRRKCEEKHHLLRCTNEHCISRWWNRDVAGSFNILVKGLSLLKEPDVEPRTTESASLMTARSSGAAFVLAGGSADDVRDVGVLNRYGSVSGCPAHK